ncbi:MAG: hypothetical protein H6725_21180 [Sandaracinaceae bacterium]|nr:hypothetical protein [Sandaracinaceae bacterium]
MRNITCDANRLPTRIDYGDATVTRGLHTETTYDERLRVRQSVATRGTPVGATGLNAVTRVHDFRYVWDAVSNLREVSDQRLASEWAAGYRPWRQTIDHDALYRVNEIDINYRDDGGQFNATQTDAATDWRAERTRPNQDGSSHGARDPMRRRPAPMVTTNAPERVRNLVYDYDWLANMTDWTDDAGVFYERSAGLLTSGSDAPDFNGWEPTHRPSAVYLSTNISDAVGGHSATEDRGGYVWLDYGQSGNVVGMTVHGQCHDRDESTLCEDLNPGTSSVEDRKAALEAGCVCAQEQHYRYDWDELNRLAEARRYDRTGGAGPWALAVQQRYRYDAGNVRMIKETIDHGLSPFAAVTLTPYPGDFERRGLVLSTMDGTYDSSPSLNSESQYNVGGARLVWGTDDPRTGELTRSQRLTLPLSDLVQSTAAVVDLQSGDLIEHTTFYPNGARETHLSTDEVSMQLEPAGFTGKEADEEVGLVYFGERYLIPRLGRWASVDPLSVHQMEGGEAMNGYHYIGGNLLQSRDDLGLTDVKFEPADDGSGAVNVTVSRTLEVYAERRDGESQQQHSERVAQFVAEAESEVADVYQSYSVVENGVEYRVSFDIDVVAGTNASMQRQADRADTRGLARTATNRNVGVLLLRNEASGLQNDGRRRNELAQVIIDHTGRGRDTVNAPSGALRRHQFMGTVAEFYPNPITNNPNWERYNIAHEIGHLLNLAEGYVMHRSEPPIGYNAELFGPYTTFGTYPESRGSVMELGAESAALVEHQRRAILRFSIEARTAGGGLVNGYRLVSGR